MELYLSLCLSLNPAERVGVLPGWSTGPGAKHQPVSGGGLQTFQQGFMAVIGAVTWVGTLSSLRMVAYSGFGAGEAGARHFPESYSRLITSLSAPLA